MLFYQAPDLRLVGYNNADWGDNLDECKSTSRYAFQLNGGAITWCSAKQSCIALSTIEAEYIAGFAAILEGVWLRRFLQEFVAISHMLRSLLLYIMIVQLLLSTLRTPSIMEKPNT